MLTRDKTFIDLSNKSICDAGENTISDHNEKLNIENIKSDDQFIEDEKITSNWTKYISKYPNITNTSEGDIVCSGHIDDTPKKWTIRKKKFSDKFYPLERWSGKITSLTDNSCVAIIENLNEQSLPKEEIVFSVHDLDEDERKFAKPGSRFYWFIGYNVASSGVKKRSSYIKFQRTVALTKEKFDATKLRLDDSLYAAVEKYVSGLLPTPDSKDG